MNNTKELEALLQTLKEEEVIEAYCCCGTKKTSSTSC